MIEQIEFFNELAIKWDQICKHDMEKIEFILDLMDLQIGDKVLDVGTGTGVLIPGIYNRISKFGEIDAVDLSENMIEVAKEKHPYDNIKFIVGNVLEMERKYYDGIICYSMFPHFKNRKLESIEILSKFLKQEGKFMIAHSQSREEINNIHEKANKSVKNDNLPEMKVLKSAFKEAGLEIIHEIDNDEYFIIVGKNIY